MTKYCSALNAANMPCMAYHMTGTRFCFTHDPSTRTAHARATGKGGMVTKADRVERQRFLKSKSRNKLLISTSTPNDNEMGL